MRARGTRHIQQVVITGPLRSSESRYPDRVGTIVMRWLAALLFALVAVADARAGVLVHIDKSAQHMFVSVDGQPAYLWRVSTGRGGFGTPTGRFRPQWMARSWFSTRYYGSPMPHAIFFHKGYAIHGTNYISRLGGPASRGCVRCIRRMPRRCFTWCAASAWATPRS